jgi:hypothetical protein
VSIRGEVYIDLRTEPSAEELTRDRKALSILDHCPDGVRIVVDIGKRTYLNQDTAWWINRHADRLELTIRGAEVDAVARFVLGARAGDTGAVA